MIELRANVSFPTRYRFGWGRRVELGAEAKAAGIARPLIVTDPGVAAQPWFADAVTTLGEPRAVCALPADPGAPELEAGVAAFRTHGADGVIAIGGGSVIDAAKLIALLAGHGGDAPGDAAPFAVGGPRARMIVAAAVAPIVAMPTTAGTGSELSTGAVALDRAGGVKRTVLHPALLPRAVVADPEATLALPAALTAATGMDALTHALEALCAPSFHPMCDGIALEALRLIAVHLPRAVAHGDDRDARAHLLMASSMAAVAFQKGLGLTHAMAHPLGALTGLHHGLANALLLPHVLAINAPAIYEPCARLADTLHLRASDPVATIREWVVELVDQLGLPARAPLAAPADAALLDRLVAGAQAETLYLATNPRAPATDELRDAYAAVLGLTTTA